MCLTSSARHHNHADVTLDVTGFWVTVSKAIIGKRQHSQLVRACAEDAADAEAAGKGRCPGPRFPARARHTSGRPGRRRRHGNVPRSNRRDAGGHKKRTHERCVLLGRALLHACAPASSSRSAPPCARRWRTSSTRHAAAPVPRRRGRRHRHSARANARGRGTVHAGRTCQGGGRLGRLHIQTHQRGCMRTRQACPHAPPSPFPLSPPLVRTGLRARVRLPIHSWHVPVCVWSCVCVWWWFVDVFSHLDTGRSVADFCGRTHVKDRLT